MWQFSTPLMIYVAFWLVTGAAFGKAIGAVLSAAIPVILIVGGFGLLLLIMTVYAIGGLLGGSED